MKSNSNSAFPTILAIFTIAAAAGYGVLQLTPEKTHTYPHEPTREDVLRASGYKNIQMADKSRSDNHWIFRDCNKGETSQNFYAETSDGSYVRGTTCKSLWSKEIKIIGIEPAQRP